MLAQRAKPDSSEVLKQLLAMPAPFPRANDPERKAEEKKHPEEFFSKDNVPPDDAPINDLLDYWFRFSEWDKGPEPSDLVKQRIFEATAGNVEQLIHFLPFVPDSEPVAAKIKEIYDKLADDKELNQYPSYRMKEWLMVNTPYFKGEIFERANRVQDDPANGRVEEEAALNALAKLDWQAAEPLLNSLAASDQPRAATAAISILYKHALSEKNLSNEEKYRERLRAIAADRSQPGRARSDAIEILSTTEWSARDDWYLSLFDDESLVRLSDGIRGMTPLDTLFDTNPDKWIPILVKMVGSNNRAVLQTAGGCLVRYTIVHPRRDVILPLLRWLTEPQWLSLSEPERAWFMQKMDQVEMPESVPGLIWIVENEETNAHWAARTLAHYKDPRAVPALKRVLPKTAEQNRPAVIAGLFASGGISEAEAVEALESYAELFLTPEGQSQAAKFDYDQPWPVPLSIGKYLAKLPDPPSSLAQAALARVASLRKKNAPLAQSLLRVAQQWQGRQINLDLIRRIAAGTADADAISTALLRRDKLRETLKPEIQELLQADGTAPGIAAVLLDDSILARTILSSGEQTSQTALLAAARLTQTSLPVELVGALLTSKNSLLVQAGEHYLLAEDSKEARKLLWQRHPGEAFITGWRENLAYLGNRGDKAIEKIETNLRAELFKENGPIEIFALFRGPGNNRVLRVYRDRAIYTQYDDTSRYTERTASKTEVANFKDVVDSNNVADMGPQFISCHYGCQTTEFLMITKEQGRRVIYRADSGWALLDEELSELAKGEGAKLHYKLEEQIKGVQVLYAGANPKVKDVALEADEIRVLVETKDEASEAESAHFSWRKLTSNKLGDVTTQPESYPGIDPFKLNALIWQVINGAVHVRRLTADSVVLARNFDGMWKQVAGSEPVRFGREDGAYRNAIATGDGKWVMAARTDTDWGNPSYVVRFNMETGREVRVKLDPADECAPVAFVAAHNKVLVRRAKNEVAPPLNSAGPDRPEYYLVDPNTGEARPVTGEFLPLLHEERRTLQKTSNADEFWAAIPDETKDQTRVGRYDAKNFTFTPLLTLPNILFVSVDMWVDEKHDRILLVYKDQLLSIPFKPQP